MSDFTKRAVLIILLFALMFVLIFSGFGGQDRLVRYDCRDAHWHPDVPVEVKRECQKMIYDEFKRQQEEAKSKRMI